MRTIPARGADVASRLEQRLLSVFWTSVKAGADRLELLLDYTRVVVRREDDWNVDTVRERHARNHGLSPAVDLARVNCFSCSVQAQLYAHHIIEIQYGGSNTTRNQVPLCFDCHQFLHPWLTEDDRLGGKSERGFESLGAVLQRVIRDGAKP